MIFGQPKTAQKTKTESAAQAPKLRGSSLLKGSGDVSNNFAFFRNSVSAAKRVMCTFIQIERKHSKFYQKCSFYPFLANNFYFLTLFRKNLKTMMQKST
jgi:hypothetical protein